MADTVTQIPQCCALGLAHAADAMIRALGGSTATLLFPGALTKELTPGLGLGSPTTQQVEVSPVAIITLPVDSKVVAARLEVLMPASTIFVTMAERLAATPQNLFDSALGIIHEGRLFRIETWNAEYFAGSPYLFRVIVQG